jgi:hypothetical protein
MAEYRRHSHTAQAAYNDLVSLLLDDAVSDIRGTPTRRERGERAYWYDRYRIGTDTKERYLGEDSEQVRARMDKHERLKAGRSARRKERARLVRLLRSERLLGLDTTSGSLVGALGKAGVFRLGGVVVGTVAFLLYEGELGLKLAADEGARTSDIDIARFEKLALALDDAGEPNLNQVLHDFRFAPVPDLEPGRAWRWRQSEGEALLQFLTPSFRDDEGLRDLPALGVSARALHHLEYLIADPIDAAAVYREGILVKAPRPERFAIHKLIVANRRREGPDSQKARKDLMQAELLISILSEDRPSDLVEAYEDAMSRGPHWQKRLQGSLKRAPHMATLIEAAR